MKPIEHLNFLFRYVCYFIDEIGDDELEQDTMNKALESYTFVREIITEWQNNGE